MVRERGCMRSSLHHVRALFNGHLSEARSDVNGNHYEKPGAGVEQAVAQHRVENLPLFITFYVRQE